MLAFVVAHLVLAAPAAPTAPQVYVEPTTVSATVATMLANELGAGALTDTATAATHVARVERVEDALLLSVRASEQLVLARTLAVDVLPASLRVAVLLIARTVRLGPPRAPRPPPPPASTRELRVVPQAFAAWWSRPSVAPQLGLLISVGYGEGWLGVQLTGAVAGRLCCSRSTGDVEADALELHAALEGRAQVFTAGAWGGALTIGTGVSGYFVSAAPVFPDSASPGTPTRINDAQLILLGGAELSYRLSERLSWVVRLTARWAPIDREVLAPAPIGGTESVTTGRVAPWLSAGVAWDAAFD
ncbi:MAG: hypothetical protein RMA76_44810 [Deltaproteobacteria bacterium]